MGEETEKPLSRSAEWQLANVFMGLCRQCGKDPIPGKKVCERCREKQAEAFVNGPGWAPSMVMDAGGFRSGVEALADQK